MSGASLGKVFVNVLAAIAGGAFVVAAVAIGAIVVSTFNVASDSCSVSVSVLKKQDRFHYEDD